MTIIINHLTLFRTRFASTLANYKTTIAHGGTFILLIHDLWGADGTQGSSAPYPGDNGDWSSWDNYLTRKQQPSSSTDTRLPCF